MKMIFLWSKVMSGRGQRLAFTLAQRLTITNPLISQPAAPAIIRHLNPPTQQSWTRMSPGMRDEMSGSLEIQEYEEFRRDGDKAGGRG